MNWKRVIIWSLIILFASSFIGLLSGFIMVQPGVDPETIDQKIKNYRLVRRAAVAIVAILCYWRLGAGVLKRRGAHVAAAFVLVQAADIGISLLYGAQPAELLDPWSMLRAALYALAGYTLARLRPNNLCMDSPCK